MTLFKTTNLVLKSFNLFGKAVGGFSQLCLGSTLLGATSGGINGLIKKSKNENEPILPHIKNGAFVGAKTALTPIFGTIGLIVIGIEKFEKRSSNSREK